MISYYQPTFYRDKIFHIDKSLCKNRAVWYNANKLVCDDFMLLPAKGQ